MAKLTRRTFGKLAGGAGLITASGLNTFAIAQAVGKVVIVGGGAGGATAAHTLKREAPALDVTLIETRSTYATSFFSNLAIGGFRTWDSLNHNYDGLRRLGVKVVIDTATSVDPIKRTVTTGAGRIFNYDKLILSPGIDMKYDSVPGYSREVSNTIPHAYQTSAMGKQQLMSALSGMADGGTFAMVMPNNPYRCPPGPYERACMIAHYLKTKKPKSRLVILDPKKAFSKQPVFMEAFDKYYKGIVEMNLSTDIDDFSVTALDVKGKELTTKSGKKVKFNAASIIPQQKAGEIAFKAGVNEGDWCPVNPETFAAKKVENIYVLGDATIAAEMPKSAFSANSQAKVAAGDILAIMAKKEKFPARFRNTCWSLMAPDDCVKVGANYAPKDGKLDPSGGFVSQKGEDAGIRKQNYAEAIGWYEGITADMFANKPATAPAKAAPAAPAKAAPAVPAKKAG
ncbi:MAG: FAD-dependent oxidoreductase [Hyphomicrobiaceae bacterium]|nr:FAD-dependent oxidoreductase [Hyphomicrobiaceae bacterium]